MLSHHLVGVVPTVSHDAIWWLSFTMPFGDCPSPCRSVDYLVHSEIIFGLVWNCFGRHNRWCSAYIELGWPSHHLPGAPVVPVFPFNCSPAYIRVCSPLHLQVCTRSLNWVSTSSFDEFTCRFIWLTLVHMLVESASDLFLGKLIN
jgi:hypothetical protein